MKRIFTKSPLIILALAIACSDSFFEKLPPAAANATQFYNEKGIDFLLIGAYSLLDGIGATANGSAFNDDAEFYVGAAGSDWLFGDVRGGDAAKGSDDYDQASAGLIERHEIIATSGQVNAKWKTCYDGVSRANDVLKAIQNTTTSTQAFLDTKTAEARFLRGHYYFELKKIYKNISWVDETTIDFKVPNDVEVWPAIEADFEYAIANLPVTQTEAGRATKGAAQAYLAKTYLFQQKYAQAKPLLEAIISSGRYSLNECFRNAFDMNNKNSAESIFAAQNIVNDGTTGENGNWGEILNHPNASVEGTCCGFYQPSYDVVNAFQTDGTGLPLLDTYQNSEVKNDFYPTVVAPSATFTPHAGNLDPRLDWTVGRRGIPYLDWGVHPGSPWIRNSSYGGPYLPKKRNFTKAQKGVGSDKASWAGGATAINIEIIRYADVLLWAAEVETEIGSLEAARGYVNLVRNRASNPDCFVMTIDADGLPTTTPAANYVIAEYAGPWTDKVFATKAVRFERRLELAMEGHRFFDLVRWGEADAKLNEYLGKEALKRPLALQGAQFKSNKHEYLPIPDSEIINTSVNGIPVLVQNPGY